MIALATERSAPSSRGDGSPFSNFRFRGVEPFVEGVGRERFEVIKIQVNMTLKNKFQKSLRKIVL